MDTRLAVYGAMTGSDSAYTYDWPAWSSPRLFDLSSSSVMHLPVALHGATHDCQSGGLRSLIRT
jgi:hypothetical protein